MSLNLLLKFFYFFELFLKRILFDQNRNEFQILAPMYLINLWVFCA